MLKKGKRRIKVNVKERKEKKKLNVKERKYNKKERKEIEFR